MISVLGLKAITFQMPLPWHELWLDLAEGLMTTSGMSSAVAAGLWARSPRELRVKRGVGASGNHSVRFLPEEADRE